jgi:hypothetical protein
VTTCPRSRSELNNWVWSAASCGIASRKSWTHISHSLTISNWWPWYVTRSC